jgi:hypothetical protein
VPFKGEMGRSSRSGALQQGAGRVYVAGLIALATSCGSDVRGGNVAGTGGSDAGAGSSGSGGAPGDAGVSLAGHDAGATLSTLDVELQTQACRDYVAAWCVRHTECEIWDESSQESCMTAQDECPERFFSQGASYSVESLNACRDVWQTFSCESLTLDVRPDCIHRGTLTQDQACRFTTQCASGACSAVEEGVECGVCIDRVESGAECQDERQCGTGHDCAFGRCQQLSAFAPEDSLSDGSPCTYDGRCQGLCAPTADGPRCVPLPAAGEACIAAPPALGARRCARDQYCDEDELCQPLPAPGAACAPGMRPCGSGNYCDSADGFAPGICREWLEPGASCDPTRRFACRERTSCLCIDAACSAALCASKSGFVHSCSDGRACPAGSECLEGACWMLHPPLDCSAP